MKKTIFYLLSILFIGFQMQSFAQTTQDSTGFAGDNFSLEGAMELFKQSSSPEDFEKRLNSEDNSVNNLDLNEDGEIDYIRVEDHMSDEAHALVLQVYINKDEIQDIAVLEIEKTAKDEAIAQIIGDAEIFGDSTIIEPYDVALEEGKSNGPSGENINMVRVVVNVWFWPSVVYIYRPHYHVYVSPWYWGVYPRWWKPWRPYPWRVFHPRCVHYHVHYRVAPRHRVVRAHRIYRPHRRSSVTVVHRTTIIRTNHKKHGVVHKKNTTTVVAKKKNGNVIAGKKTTKTVGVKNKNGKVVAGKKTTTKAGMKKKNGTTIKGKKTTTKAGMKKKNGTTVKGKKTTTKKVNKSKNGSKKMKKTKTTKVKRKR